MSGHTPGPWGWFGNGRCKELYLATTHSGRRYVMGFKRWGMSGAQPMFQPEERGLVPATDLLKFEVGDPDVRGIEAAKADDSVYRLDIRGIDCADARLIAAAPELLEALEAALDGLKRASRQLTDDHKIVLNGKPWGGLLIDNAEAAIAKARGAA